MTRRLTRAIRTEIIARVVNDVKRTREPALRQREHALVVRLTRARYGDDVFERCRALPEGWLRVHKQLNLQYYVIANLPRHSQRDGTTYGGRPHYVQLPSGALNLNEYVPLPGSFAEPWALADLGALYDEVYAYYEDATELYRDLDNLETQVRATVGGYTTLKQLAEGWPEGFAMVPAEMLDPSGGGGGLPAPRIEDLNRRIAALKAVA